MSRQRVMTTIARLALLVLATLMLGLGTERGARAAPVLASPDFQITIAPAAQKLPPGESVSFAIGIGGLDGFSDPVTLSVSGLPDGVTGRFSVNPVSPPGTSIMTLTAAGDASTGTFSLTVTGTSGTLIEHATGAATVDFGLIPICYGAVEGIVTDDSGSPIAGVSINNLVSPPLITDAAGHYRADQVSLGPNNGAREFSAYASKEPDYWYDLENGVVVCGGPPTQRNFTMVPVRPARISGRVVEGNPDPSDYSVIIPTSTPIEDATVIVYYPDYPRMTTGADGLYDIPFRLGYNNAPISPYLQTETDQGTCSVDGCSPAHRHGYWDRFVPPAGEVQPGQHVVQDIGLVRKCTASIAGTVTYADTGLPASGVRMAASNFWDEDFALSDSDGRFSFPELLLGPNNAPTSYFVDNSAYPPGYGQAFASAALDHCGDHRDVTVAIPLAAPLYYGDIEGHVYDEEKGTALAGVSVGLYNCPCDTTDAAGHYRLTGIFLGVTPDASLLIGVRADHQDFYTGVGAVDVRVGETSTLDITVLRRRFAHVTGVVRDAITHAPIVDAHVAVDSYVGDDTDAAGQYHVDGVYLADRNAERDADVRATADVQGYWPKNTPVTVRADETSMQDFDLLPICTDATISGTVVNAENQQPIENAQVIGGSAIVNTDVDGHFRLEHIRVGSNNAPLQLQVTAYAFGFYAQTKAITVFCGGTIALDFGRTNPPAAIEGYVTNETTAAPMPDVFIGSEFGGAATTNGDGYYKLTDAPLNPDGSPRIWGVTASPDGFDPQTKPVTVRANEIARLDFAFATTQPPTPTATAMPTNTPTPTGTATPPATRTLTPTPSSSATPIATSTRTPTSSATPAITRTASATASTRTPASTVSASARTPTAVATATDTPRPTRTPGGTATAESTPTPATCMRAAEKLRLSAAISGAMGARRGTRNYRARYDVNSDGVINLRDVLRILRTPTCGDQ